MNLTPLQIIGIILIVNGALTGATNEMVDLVGSVWAKHIVSLATIGSAVCGGLVTMFGGQGAQIKNVLAMPGVEKISVNSQANSTLAVIAVDPHADKIAPTPAAMVEVTKTAMAAGKPAS